LGQLLRAAVRLQPAEDVEAAAKREEEQKTHVAELRLRRGPVLTLLGARTVLFSTAGMTPISR
jgi:hypothetical protein